LRGLTGAQPVRVVSQSLTQNSAGRPNAKRRSAPGSSAECEGDRNPPSPQSAKLLILLSRVFRTAKGGISVSKHDADRRAFLVRAAVGAGAVAGLAPQNHAQNVEHHEKAAEKAPAPAQTHSTGEGHGAFFNPHNASTIAAFAERLMPGAPGKPGAHDAGVLNYIDLALAGAYADLQDFYRRGIAQLDGYCQQAHKQPFAQLDAAKQEEVIAALEAGTATGFAWPTAQEFFNTLRTHTMEGMFADPIYGGNKDFAGWKLVGFPGAQPLFTAADMQSKQAFTRAPITGLQAQAKASRKV
jgi:gluconate 2-dehydrogenase gamma chain